MKRLVDSHLAGLQEVSYRITSPSPLNTLNAVTNITAPAANFLYF